MIRYCYKISNPIWAVIIVMLNLALALGSLIIKEVTLCCMIKMSWVNSRKTLHSFFFMFPTLLKLKQLINTHKNHFGQNHLAYKLSAPFHNPNRWVFHLNTFINSLSHKQIHLHTLSRVYSLSNVPQVHFTPTYARSANLDCWSNSEGIFHGLQSIKSKDYSIKLHSTLYQQPTQNHWTKPLD